MKKLSSGIKGLDSILNGGYPQGHPTLLKGGPGCGKTILCQIFANHCITNNDNVSFVTCDESPNMVIQNMDALGLKGSLALKAGQLSILDFRPSTFDQVVGNFELDAILLRIQNSLKGNHPILIIDSLHNLFIGLGVESNTKTLLKVFNWAREQHITLLSTAAENFSMNNQSFFEEYVADCVILVKQSVREKLMTRYLRVEKYRGSHHGTNEYPFLMTDSGISIFPITDSQLRTTFIKQRLSTGIKMLDNMLGGGYLEASSLMISGLSGTAKSILSAQITQAATSHKQKVLYFSYEESPSDFISNVKSAGIELDAAISNKLFILKSAQAVEMGLEEHLISIIDAVDQVQPNLLIIDPITSFLDMGTTLEVKSLLIRFLSHLKNHNITTLFTELLKQDLGGHTIIGISSLVDTWIKLKLTESNGELNRTIHIIKSRGSATSNQTKEFLITDSGIKIQDPYIGGGNMVFGSAKYEKILLDQQNKQSIQDQLAEVCNQLQLIENTEKELLSAEEIEKKRFKLDLLEKKRSLEMQLKDISAIQLVNKQSREN